MCVWERDLSFIFLKVCVYVAVFVMVGGGGEVIFLEDYANLALLT